MAGPPLPLTGRSRDLRLQGCDRLEPQTNHEQDVSVSASEAALGRASANLPAEVSRRPVSAPTAPRAPGPVGPSSLTSRFLAALPKPGGARTWFPKCPAVGQEGGRGPVGGARKLPRGQGLGRTENTCFPPERET